MQSTKEPSCPGLVASIRPAPRWHRPIAQVLDYGSCIDADKCNSSTTCASIAGSGVDATSAAANAQFSLVEAWFPAGTYRVKIRSESHVGCNGSLTDCYYNSNIAYKLQICARMLLRALESLSNSAITAAHMFSMPGLYMGQQRCRWWGC
jgi:hypothetical protein